MRRTIAAVLAVAVLLAAGCQDQQARDQNARLQAELDSIKADKGGGNDDLLKVLLANQNKTDSDDASRKWTSFGEDMRAGFDDLGKQIKENDAASDKRMDDLESQIKKVSDLEATISTLKTMIETLESKVKNVDPNEVLEAHKDLITKEADLRVEKQQREAAEAELKLLKEQVETLEADLTQANKDIADLQGDDISKHKDYKKLEADLRKMKAERDLAVEARDALQTKVDDMTAQLQKGSNPPEEEPTIEPKDYTFTGTVASVRRGARADGPSYLMVTVDSGNPPPKDTVLVVLNERREPVCKVKVIQHYHVDDKDTLPVEEVGCATVDESASNPVAKGDTIVWIKEEPKGNAGGE